MKALNLFGKMYVTGTYASHLWENFVKNSHGSPLIAIYCHYMFLIHSYLVRILHWVHPLRWNPLTADVKYQFHKIVEVIVWLVLVPR